MRTGMKAAVAAIAIGWLALVPGSAQAIEKGPPIPPERTPAGTAVQSSFRVEPITAPDPAGGPVWGLGTYVTDRGAACEVFGRLVDGELGMIDDAGVFHAYLAGAGPIFCHGRGPRRAGVHGGTTSDRIALARGDARQCALAAPRGVRARRCPDTEVRTVRYAIIGPGVIDAALQVANRGWAPLRVTAQGALLHVARGPLPSDATIPNIRVRAKACGANARTDLLQFPRARRRGCTITLLLPHQKPFAESARSKRNRRARQLAIPIKVVRDDRIVKRGYGMRFRWPITVRDLSNEGWGIKIYGPRGSRCTQGVDGSGRRILITSYFNIEGKPGALPLVPSNGRKWCPGRYRVQLLFVRRTYRVRDREQVETTHIKVAGQARFRVPR